MGRLVPILALALAGAAFLPAGAQAAFGLNSFDVTFAEADGTPAIQAGSHPFEMTTSLGMNVSGEEPTGRLRGLFLDFPPGLIASTTSTPICQEADFETLDEGVNDCPDSTAVGVVSTAVGEAGSWSTAPVFNLVAPPGVLMRLGFRVGGVANLVVDLGLSPPPYRLLASVGEFPEAIELFAAKLRLWGVPASSLHDRSRGLCGVTGAEDSCPVQLEERPFLTLPTSCEGPQATFYEALSWEGDQDSGNALTHDGAGDPMGFAGCHRLAFDPSSSAKPTTDEAESPTGLDLFLDTFDAGLSSVAGLAQSDIRDFVVALPGGISVNSAVLSGLGVCSEADLAEEAPATPPGEGCPEASRLGTAEVQSPLLEKAVQGAVYLATPYKAFASGSPAALYIVLKSAKKGIVVKQLAELERDPETGQLVAFVEDIPQLPISHLSLHLGIAGEDPLVSPPLCGEYDTEAEFEPWAGGGTFRVLSGFQITSGPNGGPCPSGAHEGGPPVGGPPPAASGPGVSLPPILHGHRCRKGKHRVRRHGKTRCARTHRKHKPHGR